MADHLFHRFSPLDPLGQRSSCSVRPRISTTFSSASSTTTRPCRRRPGASLAGSSNVQTTWHCCRRASRRARSAGFASDARRMVARRKTSGSQALAEGVFNSVAANLEMLRDEAKLASLQKAARLLARGRRIYVLGSRSSYPVAYHFCYVAWFGGAPTVLVDGPGGIGVDVLRGAGAGDV